ncbi:hypothetical protein PCK1_000119 [Pneumocystis canis]|nr:hypothetical protein PCK1_000119 [Pneumocystis canis]
MKSKIKLEPNFLLDDKNALVSNVNFSTSLGSKQHNFLQSVSISKEYLQNKKIILLRFPRELSISSVDTLLFDSKEIKGIRIRGSDEIYCTYNNTELHTNTFGLLLPLNGNQKNYFAGQCTITVAEKPSEVLFINPKVPFVKNIPEGLRMRFKPYGFKDNHEYIEIFDSDIESKSNLFQHVENVHLKSTAPKKHTYNDCQDDNKRKKIKKAIGIVKRAIEEDNAQRYDEAYKLYIIIDEKSENGKNLIKDKVIQYLDRAETLKDYLKKISEKNVYRSVKISGNELGLGKKKERDGNSDDDDDIDVRKLKSTLENTLILESPNVKWDDIAGLDNAKNALREAVILPIKLPHLFKGNRKPWIGILLYGPPGTGKSYLAKAVATEAKSTFFSVSSSDLVSKWMGESERLVKQLFVMAREKRPAIIFIDEIDALAGTRNDGDSEASRRIKTELLVQMNGVGTDSSGILVLGASNIPWALDPAIRRRFERRVYVPLPDAVSRLKLFKLNIGDTPTQLTVNDFKILVDKTEGYSGSDIAIAVRDAIMEPVRRIYTATHFCYVDCPNGKRLLTPCSPGVLGAQEMTWEKGTADTLLEPMLTMNDFLKALKNTRPTVNSDDLKRYVQFTHEFGLEEIGKRNDGFFVYTKTSLKKNTIILKVPKNKILSPKTSELSYILNDPKMTSVISVCIAYMHEKSLGQKSLWYGYLQIMPNKVDIPKLWNHEKNWLKGTEIDYIGGLDTSELEEVYIKQIRPFVRKNKKILNQTMFTYDNFINAISVVRSRVFEIDKFHNLGLVPFADMFNHRATKEHIHFQTFYEVCKYCGSSTYCDHIKHTQNDYYELIENKTINNTNNQIKNIFINNSLKLNNQEKNIQLYDDTCDVIIYNSPHALDELFNTYGMHGNDVLLSRYGFAIPQNKWDRITMSKTLEKNDINLDRLLWWKLYGKHWAKIVLQNEISILNNTKKKCLNIINKIKNYIY